MKQMLTDGQLYYHTITCPPPYYYSAPTSEVRQLCACFVGSSDDFYQAFNHCGRESRVQFQRGRSVACTIATFRSRHLILVECTFQTAAMVAVAAAVVARYTYDVIKKHYLRA